ncbi:PH domain-containing protein [Streptomonospora wellingtoniae]|uniref:PH domain-containing protein n=1 Tax=Streptomonospora wellingtoniae TaxID=3075544 RepID=A0ABU2L007_9ACTN|nr:PH domain-containing protein [Streptomonospora sp. DSM 45055]MDT0304598.1 PH domain-containing protein [Streptomonospora sp. DSM 45055]
MKPLISPGGRVLGWGWVAAVALLLFDLALRGSGASSLVAGAVLLITVGVAYVLWLRPRVVPTAEGVRLVNPLRDTFVPWSEFTWADVTDVLRVHAGERVFRSWPLRENRRANVRENLRRAGDGPAPLLDTGADADPRSMRPVDLAARRLREEAERRKADPANRVAAAADPAEGAGPSDPAAPAEDAAPHGPVTVWAPDALGALGAPVFLLVVVLLLV